MRSYTANKYKDLVEHIDDQYLQRYMRDEKQFLADTPNLRARTVVDLGAGYGRMVPFLARRAHDVIAVEINPDMFAELSVCSSGFDNVTAVKGDLLRLETLLPADMKDPVYVVLQNSLGTIEGGGHTDALTAIISAAHKTGGQMILSLLRQPALAEWGVGMYGKLEEMVGRVDNIKSDFTTGILTTDTGYRSKWWTDEDLDIFRGMGEVVRESKTDKYIFLQLKV